MTLGYRVYEYDGKQYNYLAKYYGQWDSDMSYRGSPFAVTDFGFAGDENKCLIFSTWASGNSYAVRKVFDKSTNTFTTDSTFYYINAPLFNDSASMPTVLSNGGGSCYLYTKNGDTYKSNGGIPVDTTPAFPLTWYSSLGLAIGYGTTANDASGKICTTAYRLDGAQFVSIGKNILDLIPNYDLTYTIDNKEIKHLSINLSTGEYSTSSLEKPIYLEESFYRWLSNDVILAGNYGDTVDRLYKVDFTNGTLSQICEKAAPMWSTTTMYAVCDVLGANNSNYYNNFGNNTITFGAIPSKTEAEVYKYTWEATQEDKITSIIMGSTTFSNVSDGDITADDVVKGKTGYGLSGKVYGNLEVGLTKAEYEEALATALLIKPDEEGTNVRDDEMTPEL